MSLHNCKIMQQLSIHKHKKISHKTIYQCYQEDTNTKKIFSKNKYMNIYILIIYP